MIPRRFLPLVLACLSAAGPAWGVRATPHLDALEATLADRAAALAGATDKIGRKQLRTAEKSLARIAVDTPSLAGDLKLAKKIAGPVTKAFAADDEVMDLLTAAADAFEDAVDSGASVLARARAGLPDAKLTKKADRLLTKSGKLLTKARGQSKLKKRLSLLYKAQRSADKAADVLARALGDPVATRLVLSPPSALLTAPGETVALQVAVFDQLGRPMNAPVSFVSTDPGVASVDAAGVVSGGAVGSAQILATAGGLEAFAAVISARPAPGAIPVADEAVVGPLLPVDPESFGMGSEYTAVLRGDAPSIGDLLYGTGELPLGGEVVAVEPSGADWLVTLAIVPPDVLFAELEIRETLVLTDEHAVVPDEIAELFDAELQEDGTWVFTEREGLDATAPRRPRGTVQGTVAQQGPFDCKSPVPFPLSLAAGLSLQLQQSFALDLEYSILNGLERLVAEGQITATAAFKPRVTAAISASVECKAELLQLNIPLPGPLALVFGTQIPVGIGFKIEGSIQAAQIGFDAVAQFQSTTSAGIQCMAGSCEPVTTSTNESTATLAWVTPDPSTQFTVTAAARGFGYAELCLGNPLWNLLQLCMLEAQGGVEQTLSWSPTTVQLNNTTSASDYKLLLYFLIGAKAELMNVLDFFNVSLASISYRQDHELARSPEGSFTFEGPVALGDTVRATLQLGNVDYVGVENVQDVRFYRKDSSLSLIQKAVVPRTSAGQTTYEAEWLATQGDLGAEFGAVVVTEIVPLEFEVAPNSLETLEEAGAAPFLRWQEYQIQARALDGSSGGGNGFRHGFELEEDYGVAQGSTFVGPTGGAGQSTTPIGGLASASHSVDVQVDEDDFVTSITATASSITEVTAETFATSDQRALVRFQVTSVTAASFAATPTLTGANLAEDHVFVRLSEGGFAIACAGLGDAAAQACPAGVPETLSGDLAPGSYEFEFVVSVQGGADASLSGSLTLGP